MNLIKLEGVCKRFGEKNLFNNLSMEIEQGESKKEKSMHCLEKMVQARQRFLISLECWNLPIGEM